jgi:hypothetical protein
MGKEYKEIVNWCIEQYKFVMVECKNGKVFLLWKHHMYLTPEKQAKRVLVGKIEKKNDFIKYYSNKI